MQIGFLKATQGNQGVYFIGTLELLNEQVEVALGPNPLKDKFEGAADFEFRLPRRNWIKAGNASEKTSKKGTIYINGAIVQQGAGTVYVNLYEVTEKGDGKDAKPVTTGFNVHYTGDSVANAARRRGATAASAPSSTEAIPY